MDCKTKSHNLQKGEVCPLYVQYTRLDISTLKLNISNIFIKQSIDMSRYEHVYFDHVNIKQQEGIDLVFGPVGFDVDDFLSQKKQPHVPMDGYETSLIYDELATINKLLKKYNIHTIQSQPSYFVDNSNMGHPYLQSPFVEFEGTVNTIPILKKIINHPLLSKCLTFTFPEKNSVLRTSILRPYIDDFGNKINDVNDSDFWNNIVKVCQELHDENIVLHNITSNDSDLDRTKDWYILDENSHIIKISDSNKEKFNPIHPLIPLSLLDVRYNKFHFAFMNKN